MMGRRENGGNVYKGEGSYAVGAASAAAAAAAAALLLFISLPSPPPLLLFLILFRLSIPHSYDFATMIYINFRKLYATNKFQKDFHE